MPHLHLSLQAGHDLTLKRMKRRHLRADAVALCQEIRDLRPDVAFGADLIAGFPTETDHMFQGSLDMIHDCGLAYVHIFPYSARAGTPAAKMPQVPGAIRKERAAQLRQAGQDAFDRFMASKMGQPAHVLMETGGIGRGEDFAPYKIDAPQGQMVKTQPTSYHQGYLMGGQANALVIWRRTQPRK